MIKYFLNERNESGALFNIRCSISDSDSHWHMLVGGKSGLASAELYNWQTSVQCRLPDLPQGLAKPAGAVLNGVPIVCGSNKNCFEYSKKVKNWLRVSNFALKITQFSFRERVSMPKILTPDNYRE